jgi:hypothetical protein
MPGYLIGDVGDFDREGGEVDPSVEGRVMAVAGVTLIALAIFSWLGWAAVDHAAQRTGASIPVLLADAILASTAVVALEWLVFGLLPFTFCDGARIVAWSRRAWVAVYLPGLVLFAGIAWRGEQPLSLHAAAPILLISATAATIWFVFRTKTPRSTAAEPPYLYADRR